MAPRKVIWKRGGVDVKERGERLHASEKRRPSVRERRMIVKVARSGAKRAFV